MQLIIVLAVIISLVALLVALDPWYCFDYNNETDEVTTYFGLFGNRRELKAYKEEYGDLSPETSYKTWCKENQDTLNRLGSNDPFGEPYDVVS